MPVVRLQIRNELGLADPALYRSAPDGDPRSVIDGVAVAGLVGVLRQLGDLAEFAAEVFRDTLELVEVTTSRCNKIRNRVRNIESALTPIEKAVKVQTTHLHFAYTSGFPWHSKLRMKHKYFNRSGRPKFMTDAYELCSGPPHLSLLDRFDSAGNGACLKRYSDPSYFKKVHLCSVFSKIERDQKQRKPRHGKKKRSRHRLGVDSEVVSVVSHHAGERLRFTSFDCEMATPRSTMASEPDPSNYSLASESDKNILWSENPNKSVDDQRHRLPTPSVEIDCVEENSSQISRRNLLQNGLLLGEAKPLSVPWDEDAETSNYNHIRSESALFGCESVTVEFMPTSHSLSKMNAIPANHEMFDQDDIIFDVINMQESVPHAGCLDEIIAEEANFIEGASPSKFLAQKETECKILQKVESRSASDNACVDNAYEVTVQTSNLLTENSHEESCVQSYSFSDEESHPEVWHLNPIEKVQVKVNQASPLIIDASDLKKVCEENGNLFKREMEVHGDFKARDVAAEEFAVELGDQFKDSVCERSHGSYLGEASTPPSYQVQPTDMHLVSQMPQVVLDVVSTKDYDDIEIECKTKEEMDLRSTLSTVEVEIEDRLIHLSNKWNNFPSEASSIQVDGSLNRETLPGSCQVNPVEKIHAEVDEIAPHCLGTFSLGNFGEKEDVCQREHKIELNTEMENKDYGTADGLTVQKGDQLTNSYAESCIMLGNPVEKEFLLASYHIQPVEEVHVVATQKSPSGNIISTIEDEIVYQPMLEVELQSYLIADEFEDENRLTICIGNSFRDSLDDSYPGEESLPALCQIQPSEKINVETNRISSLSLNSSGLTDFGEHGIEFRTKRGAELQSVVKAEYFNTADEIATQMDKLFTDFLNEELAILLDESCEKEASSVSCQTQHLNKIHVNINEMPCPEHALNTTRDLVSVDLEYHTKREVELLSCVRVEEAESADGLMVEKDGRLEDPLNEEFSVLYDGNLVKEFSPVSFQIPPSQKIHDEVSRLSAHSHGTEILKAYIEKEFECQTKREVETAEVLVAAHMGDMSTCSLEESSILSDSSLDDDLSASNLFRPADDIHIMDSGRTPQTLDVLSSRDFDEEEIDCQTKHEVETQSDIKEEIVEIADKCTTQTGHLYVDSFCKRLSVLSHSYSDIEHLTSSCPVQPVENVHLNIVRVSPLSISGVSSEDFGEGDEFQTKREVEYQCETKAEHIETVDGRFQIEDLRAGNLNSEPLILSYSGEGTSMSSCVTSVESMHSEVIQTSCDIGFRDCRRNENEMAFPIKMEVKQQSCIEMEKVETVDNNIDSLNVNSGSLSYFSLDKEASSASCPISLEDTKIMPASSTYPDSYSATDSSKCSDCLGSLEGSDVCSDDSSLRPHCLGSSKGYFSFEDSGECNDILASSTRENFESASWPTSSFVADNVCHTENNTGASVFPAVSIWTNGGLLGLQPSKPPDLSGSDDATNKNHMKPEAAVSEEQAIKPKEVNPYIVYGTPSEQRQAYLGEPSNFSGFTNMFLKSTSWGKASCNKPSESSVASDDALQEESFHDTPVKLQNECVFSAFHDIPVEGNFGLPSPTPENVQFTFSGSCLEASKMKLDFFCESHVNSRDGLFPCFRLIPDHSRSCHDADSDSEDTFCRSSQYMSDDALSVCSELSSEQWDYRECGVSGDHELYDALRFAPSNLLEGYVTEDLIRASCDSHCVNSFKCKGF